jgi:hypothetical protein
LTVRRRWIGLLFAVIALPALMGALPTSVENALRTFVGSDGTISYFEYGERNQPTLSRAGKCKIYMSRTTHAMRLSCNGGAWTDFSAPGTSGTLVVADGQGGWADSGCTVALGSDGINRVLTCDTFATIDQNNQGSGLVNVTRTYGNDTNSVTGATCAATGQVGRYSRLDVDNGPGHRWVDCDGATEVNQLANPNFMLVPYQADYPPASGSLVPGVTLLSCAAFIPPYTLQDATKLAFQVDTADAVNTRTNICIYDAAKTLLLSTSRCAAGANGLNPCSADSDCPSSTCTSASAAGTGTISTTGLNARTLVQNRLYYVCAASNSATAAIKTWSNTVPNNGFLNTYSSKVGTAAEDKDGYCPLVITTITSAATEQPYVLVSAE